jgi:hypothetical protein
MEKKSNEITVIDAEVEVPGLIHKELTPAMKNIINQIDKLFAEIQISSMQAIWNVGRLITEVRDDPDKYLTKEQQSSHVDGEAVIMSVFAPIYTVEQLRSAVDMFDRYPSEGELKRLLSMRCPERPRWRLTTSHVQLLSQIPDDSQRARIEEKCAEEAYTARALANELQEIRGKKKGNAGRPHEAPKGLKQQIQDLLAHQRRFITRSENLWLNEESDNIYDDIANASPTKLDETVRGYFREIEENFSKLSDQIADHVAMCRKIREEVFDKLETEQEDEDADTETQSRKTRSHMTR